MGFILQTVIITSCIGICLPLFGVYRRDCCISALRVRVEAMRHAAAGFHF